MVTARPATDRPGRPAAPPPAAAPAARGPDAPVLLALFAADLALLALAAALSLTAPAGARLPHALAALGLAAGAAAGCVAVRRLRG